MALTQVTGPYPIFTDLDGTPLDDGYLYIGEINEDPQTNPIQVYWDSALTIVATQPIRTSNGYAYRNGSPALLYTAGEFSITIRNKRQEFVLYSPLGYGFDPAAVSGSVVKNDFVGNGSTVNFTLSATPSTVLATNVFINGVYQEKDSYSLLGNVVTFSIAPPLNSSIEIMTNETGVINSGNANNISYTASLAGASAQTVQTKLEQYVSVKDFGAVGNGVADDTAEIQAALNSGSKSILFPQGTYKVTSSLTVPAGVFLYAYGATIVGTTITAHVFDFVDGGGIEGGTITGPGNGSYSANSFAILCAGTNNAPAAPTFVNAPRIANVTLNGFGAYGVRLAYVNNPQVIDCVIKNIGYAAIGGVSCNDGLFRGNTIEGVTPGNGSDAYGIFVDRENGTSEVSDPRSYRCVISDNVVKNVAVAASNNGQGIDTHAGVDFTIANNIISQCEVGIFVTSSTISGVQALGPKNVSVTGNVVSSTLRIGYGIQIAGAENAGTVVDPAENVVVSGNSVFGYGIAGDSTSGAIRIQNTKNCSIVANTVRQSACNGVLINANNVGLLVSSNSIADPFDNSYAAPACVLVLGSSNSAHIEGNSFIYSSAALGTYVAVNSVRIAAAQTNLDISIGRNNYIGIDATHLTYSPGTFTGVNPDGLYAERGTAQIACVSGQANNQVAVTFAKRFPVAPSAIDLTITGAIAPGGKTVALRTSSITATGFTIIAYPYDLTTWSASANLDLSWRASA